MKRNLAGSLITIMLLALFIPHGEAKGTEFSGDLVMTTPNATVEAKLYVKSSTIHRVEMPKEAGGMIFLRPPKARGKIWMLDPAKKQYTILSWQQSSKDPIGAWTNIQYDMVGSVAGNETINGRSDKGSSLLLAFI